MHFFFSLATSILVSLTALTTLSFGKAEWMLFHSWQWIYNSFNWIIFDIIGLKTGEKKNQCKDRKIISTIPRDCSVSWQVVAAQSASEHDRFALNSVSWGMQQPLGYSGLLHSTSTLLFPGRALCSGSALLAPAQTPRYSGRWAHWY